MNVGRFSVLFVMGCLGASIYIRSNSENKKLKYISDIVGVISYVLLFGVGTAIVGGGV